MTANIISEAFEASQQAVAARIDELLDAVRSKDFDRLASYHLEGPKFTKFDDGEPSGRQDAETAMRAEVAEFRAVEDLEAGIDELKIDVFGPVAIATGIFRGTARVGDEVVAFSSRSTLVFVDDDGDWLIAHEHHSPVGAST